MSSTENTRRSFTLRYIENLAPKKERYNTPDAEVRHLFVVTHPTGRKVFFHLMKAFDPALGKDVPRRTQIGVWGDVTIEQAREHAEKLNSAVSEWKRNGYKAADPLAKVIKTEPSNVPTFAALVESYIVNHLRETANTPERAEYHLRWMTKKYLGAWLDRAIDKIKIQDMLTVKISCGEHRHTANRCIETVRCLFNWSAQTKDGKVRFWSVPNPAQSIECFEEKPRERFLTPEELVKFDDALRHETHKDLRDFLTIALSTGARRENIFASRWDDIDWELQTWTVPKTKNGEAYIVELKPVALETLKRRRAAIPEGIPFLFPSCGRTGHLIDLKRPWDAFRKRIGIPDVHLHDLRRTKATYEATSGVSLQLIGAGLGHKSLQSTQVYAKYRREAVRAAGESGDAMMKQMMRKARKRLKAAERKPKPKLLAAAANG